MHVAVTENKAPYPPRRKSDSGVAGTLPHCVWLRAINIMAGNKVNCRTTLTLFLANRVDYSSQKNETPRTPVRALGRIAEQPSPECCSIPSLRPDFPICE